MDQIDPRLRAALDVQLARRRAAIESGARRVGWKVGAGRRESIGGGLVIGYLTSLTELAPGQVYPPRPGEKVHADAEVAVVMGRDLDGPADLNQVNRAVAGFAAALELVDLAGSDDPEVIVADNVFHRAFTRTPPAPALPDHLTGSLVVNGQCRDAAQAADDLLARVQAVAHILSAMGESLRAGDCVITGSIVQVPVRSGDRVTADLGALGRPSLIVAAGSHEETRNR